jgi:phenylacetic acid degradation protein
VGANCYVGPGASLRGDFGRVTLGAGSNVQDCCVLHVFPGRDTLLEEDAHIGHAAVLHGCTIRRGALIGMGAILMDEAVVEEEAFVAAASFVPAGFIEAGTREYQELAVRCRASLKECRPLAAPEPDRRRMGTTGTVPLHTIER